MTDITTALETVREALPRFTPDHPDDPAYPEPSWFAALSTIEAELAELSKDRANFDRLVNGRIVAERDAAWDRSRSLEEELDEYRERYARLRAERDEAVTALREYRIIIDALRECEPFDSIGSVKVDIPTPTHPRQYLVQWLSRLSTPKEPETPMSDTGKPSLTGKRGHSETL